jgi:hypothetical protein
MGVWHGNRRTPRRRLPPQEGGIYTGLPVEQAHGRVIETEELHMAEENKRKKSWVIP